MDFDAVADVVDGIPHMRRRQGKKVYQHVLTHRLPRVLELGTHHGVSTCYLAAAVDELEGGSVTTIDRLSARQLTPNVEELADRVGLGDVVDAVFAERSFTWELRKMLDRSPVPQFDFVFIDGGHEWDITGFAFFLADRVLAPGGWMLFDDLNWSFATSPSLREAPHVTALPEDEREARQVTDVFRLLVGGDPRYTTRVDGNWGWAQKAPDVPDAARPSIAERASAAGRQGLSRVETTGRRAARAVRARIGR